MKSDNLRQEEGQCPKQWANMVGDSERRFCEECKIHVHNLSEMSEESRKQLMSSNEDLCGTYYSKPDGTLLSFKALPIFQRVLARFRIKFSESLLSFLISFLTVLRRNRGIQSSKREKI